MKIVRYNYSFQRKKRFWKSNQYWLSYGLFSEIEKLKSGFWRTSGFVFRFLHKIKIVLYNYSFQRKKRFWKSDQYWLSYGLFSEIEKLKSGFWRTSGFDFRFLHKPEMTAKWMRFSQKRNFENRFINSKANVDYVGGGGGGEVRLNCAYLGLLASKTSDRPKTPHRPRNSM